MLSRKRRRGPSRPDQLRDQCQEFVDDDLTSGVDVVINGPFGHERSEVVAEVASSQLSSQVLLGQPCGVALRPIRGEAFHDRGWTQPEARPGKPQVEEVATLGTLVQSSELGRDEFFRTEGLDVGLSCEPGRAHRELMSIQWPCRRPLMSVHFDLDPHCSATGLKRRAEKDFRLHRHCGLHLHTESRTDDSNSIEQFAHPVGATAHVVEVFAIAERRREVELVQAGSAAEDELLAEVGIVRNLDDQTGEDEVLLDLVERRPADSIGPLDDVRLRDHRSGSRSVFTRTFQRRSSSPDRGPPASSAVGATRTWASSARQSVAIVAPMSPAT